MSNNIERIDVNAYNEDVFLADKTSTDWHSKNTIIFGSLLEDGFDWGRNNWTSYTMSPEVLESIRMRINAKIEDEFFYREIGVLPVAEFKHNLKRKLNEIMSDLGPIYSEISRGLDIKKGGDNKSVERDVRSEYPQAQLDPKSQDYASYANERAIDNFTSAGQIDAIAQYSKLYNEPDQLVLKHIDVCFSSLLSFNF